MDLFSHKIARFKISNKPPLIVLLILGPLIVQKIPQIQLNIQNQQNQKDKTDPNQKTNCQGVRAKKSRYLLD